MKENNKFETNQNGSAYTSSLYENDSRPQPAETPYSSVYAQPNAQTGQSYQHAGGQPINGAPFHYQNQPGFQSGFIPGQNHGPQYTQPDKRKKGVMIGVIVVIAVVFMIAVCLIFSKLFGGGSPEKQLEQGMKNIAKELEAYTSSISEDIGLLALNELKSNKPMRTNIDVSITDPIGKGDLDNISFTVDAITDRRNKMAKYDLNFGTYGLDVEFCSIVATDNTLYLSVPLAFGEEVYSLDLTNIGDDFNHSAWAEMFDLELPQGASYTLFEFQDTLEDIKDADDVADLDEIIDKYDKAFSDATTYQRINTKRDFTIDGRTVSCGGISLIVGKDAYNEIIENLTNDILASEFYSEFIQGYYQGAPGYEGSIEELRAEFDALIEAVMSIRLEQDFVMNIYLDGNGRIVNVSTPADIAVSSTKADIDTFAIEICFTGKERTLDEIDGGIYVKSGDQVYYFGVLRTASVTESLYSEDFSVFIQDSSHANDITIRYRNDWNDDDKSYDMQISVETVENLVDLWAEGEYTDIVKGEAYTVRVNNAALSVDGEDVLIMSATVKTEPAQENIEVPQNATNLLEMSVSEINDMLYGASSSID